MSNKTPIADQNINMQQLVDFLVDELLQRYNLSVDTTRDIVLDKLSKTPKLLSLLATSTDELFINGKPTSKLTRLAVYKRFLKELKHTVYQEARTYFSTDTSNTESHHPTTSDQILHTHSSTRERQEFLDQFFKPIQPLLRQAKSIVDIGSGLFPLQCDANLCPNMETYIAIDQNDKATNLVKNFKQTNKIHTVTSSIETVDWNQITNTYNHGEPFDIGFVLKTIPVVQRTNKRQFPKTLINIPAKVLIISANRQGLAKKTDITKRERKTLLRFIELTGRKILLQYDIPSEIIYVIS